MAESTERPQKRARTIAESDAPVERSTKFWLDHGDVILQVEFLQFRLTKSTLAFYSPIFRDMFSLPLPPDEPLMDNCPVVVLSGDRSADWVYLLDTMFPPEYRSDEKPTVEELCGVLRLSKKYDIATFRRGCLRRLKCEFPTTLAEFDKITENWTHLSVPEHAVADTNAHIINLAREVGLASVLPVAFYGIMQCDDMDDILETAVSAIHKAEDRLACAWGHMKMMSPYTESPLRWMQPKTFIPCASCTQWEACESRRNTLHVDLCTRPHAVAGILNVWLPTWVDGMCEGCATKAKQVYDETRSECWEKLPSYFGLPEWKELKRMDFE